MSFVLIVGFVLAIVAIIAVPIRLASTAPIPTETLSIMTSSLLWVAGFFSGLMTLGILAAALWGMDTRLPWGLGVYPYLIPALSLPAFLLLRFSSLTTLSRVFWFLTAACAVAWYFGDRADRVASGLKPISDSREIIGMFLNAFTILFVMISIFIQLAALCRRRERHQIDATVEKT